VNKAKNKKGSKMKISTALVVLSLFGLFILAMSYVAKSNGL